MKRISLVLLFMAALCSPMFASVTIISPNDGATVASPFTVTATASTCDSQSITAMGYSLDDSSSTTIIRAPSLNALVVAGSGNHVLHVKSWGAKGAYCGQSVAVAVSNETVPPPNVLVVSNIQDLPWAQAHDPSTPGSTSGTSVLVSSPSISGSARRFTTNFSSSGGELYHVSFGADPAATNFLYDAHLYFDSVSGIANVEMDMNQVMSNGQTVIYGFQCDGYSGTWDYTVNTGTPAQPKGHWVHTDQECNPRNWKPKTWHHVQISYSRDATGNVTYHSVVFDGNEQDLKNAVGLSAFALGWNSTLLTNFQIDGLGSGQVVAYVDDLTVYRW